MARFILATVIVLVACAAVMASDADPVLNFISLGDWGFVDPDQASVSKSMGAAAAKYNASFLTALGDNFYTVGVASDTDPLWQSAYRNIYTAPSLNIPWYVLLGNHDHYLGHGQAEIDYYKNHRDTRWICPSFWYSQTFNVPGGKTLQIVMIDTPLLAIEAQRQCIQDEIMLGAQSHSDLADYDAQRETLEATKKEQLEWINATLAASRADWLIVAGHFPVYSGGEHGNTPEMITDIKPLLEKYKVDAYLCGHDHTLQHLQENNVQYFVSGGGTYRGTWNKTPQAKFGTIIPGFMIHQVSATNLTTILIDRDNKEIYKYTQAPRRTF